MIYPLTYAALLAVVFWLGLRLERERRRNLDALDRLGLEYRIALTFVRDEMTELPHEFAAVYLAGNRTAMDRKFPGFFEYRAICIADARRDRADLEAAE
jgi:hypothetical protein